METPNLNYVNELSGQNGQFRIKIISIIKKELPFEVEMYDNYMQQFDFFNAAQSVHKLKHKISILGLEKSYYLAVDYEHNLKNDSIALKYDFEVILKTMLDFVVKL
jgi:FKBP-type peptidyl-prolyl cis-trans isomerase (trigger factor)